MSQPSQTTQEALEFIREHPDQSKYNTFKEGHPDSDVSREAWKRLRWEVRHDRRYKVLVQAEEHPHVDDKPVEIPANINLITEAPLRLDLTDWLYASDFHAPMHHQAFTERLIKVGRAAGVKDLIIGGDVFDLAGLSHFPRTERQAATEDVMRVGGELLLTLARDFRLYILPGNHDERYVKRLNDFTTFSRLVWGALGGNQPQNKITITSYDYIYVGPDETGWVVGHPRYFSTIPARGGAEVAMIKHRSVIGAHNHIIGAMQSKCGRYVSVDPGHMTDPSITPYHLQSNGLSKYPEWSNGFVLVRNNIHRICADKWVDWAELGAA